LQFNSKKTSLSFKQIYAEIISDKYNNYINELANLKVPGFMDKTFNMFLNSVKYKSIYFNLYSAEHDNKSLGNIRNEAILLEEQFWLDIYRRNSKIKEQLRDAGALNSRQKFNGLSV